MARRVRPSESPLALDRLREEMALHPQDLAIAQRYGWALYGQGQFRQASELAQSLLRRVSGDLETTYLMGLALKRLGDTAGALAAFDQVAKGVSALDDPTRANMLHRLAVGHVNMLREGAWNLEPETWVRA